ncbi:MAG: hypothetical protein AMXMBFR33_35290 [Candidatus Xenobia bacterium]
MGNNRFQLYSLLAMAVVCLAIIGVAKSMMKPQTYPGDRTEMRDCRWCGGTGEGGDEREMAMQGEGMPPRGGGGGVCPGCRGKKKLSVIVPGPNHPAVVRGSVRDVKAMGAEATSPEAAALLAFHENRSPGPVKGAVGGAKVVFDNGSKKVEYTVPANGKIKTMLVPGHYKVTVTAEGFQDYHDEVDVAARREPIWDERARLITEESVADQTEVLFLLSR